MHPSRPHSLSRFFGSMALALSISLSAGTPLCPIAFAAPGDVNSINDGQTVAGGTYYNTAGNKTTFVNSGGNGLYLHAGTTVTGLESDAVGNPTGHGGWLHFYAPGQVVRLDGTVNVSALMGKGGYAGNGGRVTVDSALLYQNGSIYANGKNGGSVQMNVGSAMFGPAARIDARGFANNGEGGAGGVVSIHSPGVVDVQRGAIIDTSGRVIGTYDTNVIAIEGGLINIEGVLRADGVEVIAPEAAIAEGRGKEGREYTVPSGGTIRLVASGASKPACLVDCALEKSTDASRRDLTLGVPVTATLEASAPLSAVFTGADRDAIIARQQALIADHDGDIKITASGLLSANGADVSQDAQTGRAQDGGSIILSAMRHVASDGLIRANGGNGIPGEASAEGLLIDGGHGGTIAITAGAGVYHGGQIQANGGSGGGKPYSASNSVSSTEGEAHATANALGGFGGAASGGNGGLIAFSYRDTLANSGLVQANGGAGGQGASAYADAYSEANSAHATANAIGSTGGTGGDGGLILLSGYSNPVGGGHMEANGGAGGTGGNATAIATARGERSAIATANAIAGSGGEGGNAGRIVAPDPASFDADQTHSTRAGLDGAAGHALAKADATSGGYSEATANATSGFLGLADAIAYATQAGIVIGGDPKATANALAGDFGIASALTSAIGRDEAFADSNATAGQYGQATADATAFSQEKFAEANAGALTSFGGCSLANAYALSRLQATADAQATSGVSGVSLADALAKSLQHNADSTAKATSGEDGYSRANGQAIALAADASVDASATSGEDGYAEANGQATADDDVKKLAAKATSGQGGVSIATGAAQAGDGSNSHVEKLDVSATSGQDGQSLASGTACAGGDVSADVAASAGQAGKAVAVLTAHAGDDIENADVSANAGAEGVASASGDVSAQDEVKNLSVSALGGLGATALALAKAAAANDIRTVEASSTVSGDGLAKAEAWGTTGNGSDDDADVSARALSGAFGTALAEAHGLGGDDIQVDANATSGANGFSEAKAIAEATHESNGDADATANATTGAAGQGRAIAHSTSQDDGSARARVVHGAGGGGEAQISIAIDDDWSASALPGGLSIYLGSGFSGATLSRTRYSGIAVGPTPAVPSVDAPTTQVAVWTPGSALSTTSTNAIAQLQRNELAFNGPNAILLSVDQPDNLTRLSQRWADATVRTLSHTGPVKNLIIGSASSHTLILDQPLEGLNTLTVLAQGSLINPSDSGGWTVGRANTFGHPSIGGGLISLLSVLGGIENHAVLRTLGDGLGGGITLAAAGRCRSNSGILNTGVIATNPGWSLPDHGGSIILKSATRIENRGDIDANGDAAGGTIVLRTCGDILNTGTIKAMAAGYFAGPRDGDDDTSHDEDYYFLQTQDDLVYDSPYLPAVAGLTHATGGIILSQAGGVNSNQGQMLVDADVFGARGDGGYLLQYGGRRANNCGLLSANGNDTGLGGAVLLVSAGDTRHRGTIRALGGLNNGVAVLAANDTLYLGPDAQILAGETHLYLGEGGEGQPSAVYRALCMALALPGGGGNGPTPPRALTPAYDLLGLFQEERFGPLEDIPSLFRLVLRIPDPAVMLSSTYLPVTEEILALALEDFHRQLALGNTIAEAERHAILYLREAGVTPQVASALAERAAQGQVQADTAIVKALEAMAKTPSAQTGGSPLVQ